MSVSDTSPKFRSLNSAVPVQPRRSQRASKPVSKNRDVAQIHALTAQREKSFSAVHASVSRRGVEAIQGAKTAGKKATDRATGNRIKKRGRPKREESVHTASSCLHEIRSNPLATSDSVKADAGMAAASKGRGRPKTTTKATTNGHNVAATTINSTAPSKRGQKRKTDEENEKEEKPAVKPSAKKARVTNLAAYEKKKVIINEAPTARLDVFVCGEGSNGELGLGTAKNVIDVKRPRLNPLLPANDVGVVQVACGGMHALALTHDGKVLSWGVNDGGALGRPTGKGPLQDMDEGDDNDSETSDSGLNPDEANPGAVAFPSGAVIVKVAAGDGISLALTDDGRVYGWGEFRGLQGEFGFWRDMKAGHTAHEVDIFDENGQKIGTKPRYELAGIIKRQMSPRLYNELSNITDIACGNNHCLARDRNGMIFTWGIGEQHQLGRRQIERIDTDLKRSLIPQPLRTGKTKFISIFCAADHSFAIDSKNQVHGWGFNGYGQLAIKGTQYFNDSKEWKDVPEEVVGPIIIKALTDSENPVVKLAGGQKHSMALRQDGTLLTWGLIEFTGVGLSSIPPDSLLYNQEPGRGDIASAVINPVPVPGLGKVVYPGCGSEHTLAINSEGKAYSWGSGSVYQLGLGEEEDQSVPTMIDNTAVRGKKLNWASGGGQYSMFTAPATVLENGA